MTSKATIQFFPDRNEVTAYATDEHGTERKLIKFTVRPGNDAGPIGTMYNPDGSVHREVNLKVEPHMPTEQTQLFVEAWEGHLTTTPILETMVLMMKVTMQARMCNALATSHFDFVKRLAEGLSELPVVLLDQNGAEINEHVMNLAGMKDTPFTVNQKTQVIAADTDTSRFTAARVTDFVNAMMPDPGNHERFVNWQALRVIHFTDPTWEPMPEDLKSEFVGCWRFDHLAIGVIEGETCSFSILREGRVYVRDAKSICPAGNVAVPEQMYRVMGNEDGEPAWLSREEVNVFNREHATSEHSIERPDGKLN